MTTHEDMTVGMGRDDDGTVTRLKVRFLGGFQLRVGAAVLGPRQLGGTKPRLILEALLAHGGAPVSKDRLVSMLWEGKEGKGSRANLETYACVLRKHLHAACPGVEDVIGSVAGSYSLDMARIDLDLDRYRKLVDRAMDPRLAPGDSLPLFVEAMAMGESDVLPEEDDLEWLVDLRRRHADTLHSQFVHGAEKVMDLAPSLSRHWSLQALAQDSLDEAAWMAYLTSVEMLGLHAEGLRAYNDCRRVFARELGCSPGRVLQETYVRLLRGANEANGELSRLLDAVVSLHTLAGVTDPAPPTGRRPASRAVSAVALEEARLALSTLLNRASSTTNGGAAAARTA
jgi:DNA-binding SARP family transcriptional activator